MYKNLKRKPPEIKPLESTLSLALVREIDQFRKAEAGKKWNRDAKGLEVLMAYLGKTQGGLNSSGLWEQVQLADGEIWATVPLFAAMLRSIQKEAARSKPQYSFRADFADVDQQEVARYGTALMEYLTKRFFNPEEEQEDVLSSMSFGFGAAEIEWDETAGEDQTLVEVACPMCGTTGHVHKEDAEQSEIPCPGQMANGRPCESTMAPRAEIETPAGDVMLRRIDPFSLNSNTWANRHRPAIWWSIDEAVDRAVWEQLHPDVELPRQSVGSALGETLMHLRRQRSFQRAQMGLESSIATSRARSETLSERDVIRQRDFLAPAVYERRATSSGEELPSGTKIPPGTAIKELFPDGLCVLRDGSGRVLDIYAANPTRSIHIYNFSAKPNDRWGASVAAQALECQYALEEDLSQLQTVASEMGNPTMFYDQSLFDGRLGTHPSGKYPVHARLTEKGLSDLIHYAPAASPSPVIFNLVMFYEQRMQGVLGASSGSGGGLPDAVGPTATANMNARAEAEGQQGQYLELRAAAKMEILQEGVRLFAEHADIRRAVSMGGPFADGATLMLEKSMLPEKFALEMKKDSWWPRDRGQQQQAEMMRLSMMKEANAVSMMTEGTPIDPMQKRWINDLTGSEIGNNMEQIGAEIAVRQWKKAKAFIDRQVNGQPIESDLAFMGRARAELVQQAMAAMQQQAMMSTIQNLGATAPSPPMGAPPSMDQMGGMPGAMPPEMGMDPSMVDPMMPPAPQQIPEPPFEEVVLAALELAVPMRPGLMPVADDIAGQLQFEALKVDVRDLPDVYLEWLERRATAYDALARERKSAEAGATGTDPTTPAGGPPMNGTGSPIGDALQTKLAAIQSGTADSLGLPGTPSMSEQPAAAGEAYG